MKSQFCFGGTTFSNSSNSLLLLGSGKVIEAIAAGRRAAVSIDKYLGGDGTLECRMRNVECGSGQPYEGRRESGFAELKRVAVPTLPLAERHAGFCEVELCLSDEAVKQETHRCFNAIWRFA